MKKIKLTQGKFAMVDNEDFPILNRFNWILDNRGEPVTDWRNEDGIRIQIPMKRFVFGSGNHKLVKYKSGNFLDNRKDNLALSTISEVVQAGKMHKDKLTSKYKGVSSHRDKYAAKIMKNGVSYYLGIFENEIEAALAYNEKAEELYGEFAYQNKI